MEATPLTSADADVVKGKITRLYPSSERFYFHTAGDKKPYGYTESDYSYLSRTQPNYEAMYQLLIEAAKNGWEVVVKRGSKTQINDIWSHYGVSYIYVDL